MVHKGLARSWQGAGKEPPQRGACKRSSLLLLVDRWFSGLLAWTFRAVIAQRCGSAHAGVLAAWLGELGCPELTRVARLVTSGGLSDVDLLAKRALQMLGPYCFGCYLNICSRKRGAHQFFVSLAEKVRIGGHSHMSITFKRYGINAAVDVVRMP
jgi:hypothetical protein